MTTTDTVHINSTEAVEYSPESHLKTRTSSISLLSAELQKATRGEANHDLFMEGDREPIDDGENEMHPLEGRRSTSFTRLEQEAIAEDQVHEPSTPSSTWNKPERSRFMQHEKSSSDQGIFNTRQTSTTFRAPSTKSPASIRSQRREADLVPFTVFGDLVTDWSRPTVTARTWDMPLLEALDVCQSCSDSRAPRHLSGVTRDQLANRSQEIQTTDPAEAADPGASMPSSHISESTIKERRDSDDTARNVDTSGKS
ncbi:hypothetical protein BKA57DRAFT_444022 [Linnemannia elongata]|nr:hypothetical protein BKA57DRAFT_444022 [Linnemannia elongata]